MKIAKDYFKNNKFSYTIPEELIDNYKKIITLF
jgi:hypothetical protein